MHAGQQVFRHFGIEPARHIQSLALGVHQNVGYLVLRELGEHGDRNAAGCRDREKRYGPVGHILRQDGNFVSRVDAEIGQQP